MIALNRTFLPALLVLITCLVFAQFSGAWWSGSGGGDATAATATVPAGNAPSVSLASTTTTVEISQIGIDDQLIGALGGGYLVKRYPANGGPAITPDGTCGAIVTGVAATISCTETSTPRGDWSYTVTPTLFQWTGAESPSSATITLTPDAASDLSAMAGPAGAINLSWTAGAGATGYNVYRRTAVGAYDFGAPVNGGAPVSGTAFSDATAVDGMAYNYVIRSVVIGSAGQQIESGDSNESAVVTADASAPTGVTLAPIATPISGSVAFSGSATDAGSGVSVVAFEYKLSAGSTWVTACADTSAPYSCAFDSATIADGLYDFRALATDGVGNQASSAVQTIRMIDNTAPTASAIDPGTYVSGNVTVGGTASDAGSGIATMSLNVRDVGAGVWVTICASTTSPLSCTYDTALISDGARELQLVVTDNAGNTTATPIITPIYVDNTAPTVTMNDPGTPIGGVVSLGSTATDASPIATVLYQYKSSASTVWTTACTTSASPFTCNFNTALLTEGLYDFRAIATEMAGNLATSAAVTNRRIDNTAPTAVAIATTNGGTFGRPDANDTVIYTFSEQMLASSILAGWDGTSMPVTALFTQGSPDTLTIWDAGGAAALPLGSVTIGTGYVTTAAVLNASMVRTGNTVVITLGSLASGAVETSAAKVRMVWTPAAAATDLAGNAMTTTPFTEPRRNDTEF